MSEGPSSAPLRRLYELGQSPWLDYIERRLIDSGELERLVEEEGIRGVTSNPAIFESAITSSDAYDSAIRECDATMDAEAIYESLGLADITAAADVLRAVHDASNGRDGFVSFEISPHLARDTAGTVRAARRLWEALDRPNVMIKVPATREGLPAIRQLITDGIHVNVTLLFDLGRYREVIGVYLDGLEDRARRGESLGGVASVASFFVSRIDALFDRRLERIADDGGVPAKTARSLSGLVAIACARRSYAIFQECFEAPACRFTRLRADGGRPQRLLWASTSPKDPSYPDTKYVDALIGPKTVTTLPMETLRAYADHGQPAPRLIDGLPASEELLNGLHEVGIDLEGGAQQLLDEGLRKFEESYDRLLAALAGRIRRGGAGEGS